MVRDKLNGRPADFVQKLTSCDVSVNCVFGRGHFTDVAHTLF